MDISDSIVIPVIISGYMVENYFIAILDAKVSNTTCFLQPRLVYIRDIYRKIIFAVQCLTHAMCVDIVCHIVCLVCMEYLIIAIYVRGLVELPTSVT